MALNRPDKHKALAINIALVVTFVGSLALVVWQRVAAARIDDLIERAVEARGAGDIAAFEGYRQSAGLLFQLGQSHQPWMYAGYFGIAVVLIVAWSRRTGTGQTL